MPITGILAWVLENRVCSHKRPESTVLGHRSRASSENAALDKIMPEEPSVRNNCWILTLHIRHTSLVQFLAQYVMSESDNHNEGGGIAWIRET